MPRPIRIALTLFASSTILVLLIRQRAIKLQNDLQSLTGELAEEVAREESQMIAYGLILAGLLAVGGFTLVIISMVKSRRKALNDHGG
ncbi:hypothetical protein [Haloferula rosea]|uniref:Uncharacterized protein n=1 Tax=Haloferula rosea TaxID=490093 RepID=A0A934RF30_9BACT|nr:hypothetical protein [Haloferula rosea]MBK1827966.1 hypothetical protein [Haloferula rosea]